MICLFSLSAGSFLHSVLWCFFLDYFRDVSFNDGSMSRKNLCGPSARVSDRYFGAGLRHKSGSSFPHVVLQLILLRSVNPKAAACFVLKVTLVI